MKRIDRYIIRTFLSTFLVSLALIIAIVIVFDVSEKIDDFLGKHGRIPTLNEILFSYYLNFVPYFAGLYAPLFVFISVIYFTSRMAYRTEIVAILVSGVSYYRFLRPFLLTAGGISLVMLLLVHMVIPYANEGRLLFEKKYFGQGFVEPRDLHRQIKQGTYMYMEFWSPPNNFGQKFSIDKVEDNRLVYKLMAQNITYDTLTDKWRIHDYMIRTFRGDKESIRTGPFIDTVMNFTPDYLADRNREIETMNYFELNKFIEQEVSMGSTAIDYYLIEKHKRTSTPFSTIILTLIAVPLASRKVRGGIGLHIGMGIALGFTYIFFDKISVTYATNGSLDPLIAVWLPNIIFAIVGIFLVRKTQM